MKLRQETGVWWLASEPERIVAGTLEIEPGGMARLALIGAFRPFTDTSLDFRPELIHGFVKGKKFTLHKCYVSGFETNFPGIHKESYQATFVIVGAHVERPEALVFKKMRQQYDALFAWTGLSGASLLVEGGPNGSIAKYDINFEFPEPLVFRLEDATIRLEILLSTEGSPITPRMSVSQTTVLEIEPSSSCSLVEYLEHYFYHLQNFVTFGSGRAVCLLRTEGVLVEPPDEDSPFESWVEVHFHGRGPYQERSWDSNDMLFTLKQLGSDSERALRRWMQHRNELGPIYDLYFGTLFQERPYIHQRFLSLAQALESFHRRIIGGRITDDETFERVQVTLKDTINSPELALQTEARETFHSRFRYMNEPSLRGRLRELVDSISGVSGSVIRNRSLFVRRVVDTRNYYTHYDEAARRGAVEVREMPLLCDQMQFLLEVALLHQVGLAEKTIRSIVSDCRRYQQLPRKLELFDR